MGMGMARVLVLVLVLVLGCVDVSIGFEAHQTAAAADNAGVEPPHFKSDSDEALLESMKQQLKNLESKAAFLESAIEEKDHELKNKDSTLNEKDKLVEEKLKTIASLENEIQAIQNKKAGDLEAEVTKAYSRVHEMEKQVENLEHSLRQQIKKKQSLELRASEAENKATELLSKYEKLHKVVAEQKARVQKAEQALQFAETTMLKAQAEAKAKLEELKKVHGAWLPPWLFVYVAELKAFSETHWANYGKPAMDFTVEKALEKTAVAHDWAKPHIEAAKHCMDKQIPVVKEKLQQFMITVAPHMETLKVKAITGYELSKNTVSPHIAKAHELLQPHVQKVKDVSGPYIDQFASFAQPHVNKVRVILQPYVDSAVLVYGRFLASATKHHYQLQGSVRKTLKKYELTAALATKELVWFVASALLALPVLAMFMVYSSIFSSNKRSHKPARSSQTGNANKKHKRRHVDK